MLMRPKGGDRPPPTPGLWNYEGSDKGRQTLAKLDLVKCACGATNMVDDSPTGLANRCRSCGIIVG